MCLLVCVLLLSVSASALSDDHDHDHLSVRIQLCAALATSTGRRQAALHAVPTLAAHHRAATEYPPAMFREGGAKALAPNPAKEELLQQQTRQVRAIHQPARQRSAQSPPAASAAATEHRLTPSSLLLWCACRCFVPLQADQKEGMAAFVGKRTPAFTDK